MRLNTDRRLFLGLNFMFVSSFFAGLPRILQTHNFRTSPPVTSTGNVNTTLPGIGAVAFTTAPSHCTVEPLRWARVWLFSLHQWSQTLFKSAQKKPRTSQLNAKGFGSAVLNKAGIRSKSDQIGGYFQPWSDQPFFNSFYSFFHFFPLHKENMMQDKDWL